MLRLTGDVLSSVVGYGLVPSSRPRTNSNVNEGQGTVVGEVAGAGAGEGQGGQGERAEEDEEPANYTEALRELLDWLDDLDQAWVAVLQSQVWDPEAGEGVDLILDADDTDSGQEANVEANGGTTHSRKSTPISQTDVTRLRSLLVTSIANLEEWLSTTKPPPTTTTNGGGGGGDDVAAMLERLGLLDEFDDLFSRTMDFLGGFGGGFVIEPETIIDGIGEDEDEDMSDMVEVVMSGCS